MNYDAFTETREHATPCPNCGELGMSGASNFRMARGGQITGTIVFLCGRTDRVAPSLHHGYFVEPIRPCNPPPTRLSRDQEVKGK